MTSGLVSSALSTQDSPHLPTERAHRWGVGWVGSSATPDRRPTARRYPTSPRPKLASHFGAGSVLWQIMMEVDKYPQWYSAMLEASGTPRLGARLKFRVKAMDGSPRQLSFTGTVVEFVPERRLVWTGGMFPILMGRHFFEFVPMETEVIQGEEFRGLYPLFAGRKKMMALRPAYEQFNHELAARAAHPSPARGE